MLSFAWFKHPRNNKLREWIYNRRYSSNAFIVTTACTALSSGAVFLRLRTNCSENSHCSLLAQAVRRICQPAEQEIRFVFPFVFSVSVKFKKEKKRKKTIVYCSNLGNNEKEMHNWGLQLSLFFFRVTLNKMFVMHRYCQIHSGGSETPRDKQPARSANLVPRALNNLFHSPHRKDLWYLGKLACWKKINTLDI